MRPGETVRFECLAEGDPRPNVSWRKLRHPLVSYAAAEESEDGKAVLEIRRCSTSDSGVYICSARNSAGVTEERIQLIGGLTSNGKDYLFNYFPSLIL